MNFSQRLGLVPKTKPLQLGEMDADLRNGLWNAFYLTYVQGGMKNDWEDGEDEMWMSAYNGLFTCLWVDFLKKTLDTLPNTTEKAVDVLKKWFFDTNTTWHCLYGFLEFIAKGNFNDAAPKIINLCNAMMERESSGYRFVGNQIAPITNEYEIAAVEEAEQWDDSPFAPASQHIRVAVKLLSDRAHADYRNSIKESISAVESVCKVLAKAPNASLDQALAKLKQKVEIHGAMVSGFGKLYGYTSDADGIRHCMMDESASDFEDAKYMLVSCSAFVNFLIGKAIKAGLFKSDGKVG
jgi:hypothetical protein